MDRHNMNWSDWIGAGYDAQLYGLQVSEHRLQVVGPQSGHSVKTIALCQDAETARCIFHAINAYWDTYPKALPNSGQSGAGKGGE